MIVKMPLHKGFTMMEILVVIVMVGILASFALSQLEGMKERSLDRMVKKNLELIKAAQVIFKMEGKDPTTGYYYVAGPTGATLSQINQNLRSSIPINDGWSYQLASDRVSAKRVGGTKSDRTWTQEYPPATSTPDLYCAGSNCLL